MKLAVLISGGGTTLQNLLDRIADGRLAATVEVVISSRADAFGLERARLAGIPAHVVARKAHPTREAFGDAIWDHVRAAGADLVVLGGFLQLLPIPPEWVDRVVNVHPSLLPAFGGKGFHGLHVHAAALAAGVKVSGCTVHFVDNEYDHGSIIVQRAVAVEDDDSPETLQARVFAAECEALPEAISLIAAGRLRREGNRIRRA